MLSVTFDRRPFLYIDYGNRNTCYPDKIYIIIIINSIYPSAIRDKILHLINTKSRRGRDRMVVVLQLPMQSVSITTDAVRWNLDQDEAYSIIW
jgi:hypothetical protein